jgi:hypothetical protein
VRIRSPVIFSSAGLRFLLDFVWSQSLLPAVVFSHWFPFSAWGFRFTGLSLSRSSLGLRAEEFSSRAQRWFPAVPFFGRRSAPPAALVLRTWTALGSVVPAQCVLVFASQVFPARYFSVGFVFLPVEHSSCLWRVHQLGSHSALCFAHFRSGTPARASVLGGQAPAEDFFSGIVFSFAACDCRSSLTLRAAELNVQVF